MSGAKDDTHKSQQKCTCLPQAFWIWKTKARGVVKIVILYPEKFGNFLGDPSTDSPSEVMLAKSSPFLLKNHRCPNIPSSKLTVRPFQIGVGRLVSTQKL